MYSQAKVLAGGLVHIPVIIGVFYLILTFFNKRALKFTQDNKVKKSNAKVVVTKPETKKVPVSKSEAPKTVKKKHADE